MKFFIQYLRFLKIFISTMKTILIIVYFQDCCFLKIEFLRVAQAYREVTRKEDTHLVCPNPLLPRASPAINIPRSDTLVMTEQPTLSLV